MSAEWIFANPSRSFFNAILDSDLMTEGGRPESGWAIDQDYIPRKSSSASVVVEGVVAGSNPDATTIWTVLGYPPCGYAVASWVKAGEKIAAPIAVDAEGTAPANRLAVALKRKVFPVTRGNGSKYMRTDVIAKAIDALRPYEQQSLGAAAEVRDAIAKDGFSMKKVEAYNNAVKAMMPTEGYILLQVK